MLDLRFEIDHANERVGWIDCFLTYNGQRHRLAASDVFPPFESLFNLLRALVTQCLPYDYYWDEEGKGAHFTALALAADSSQFHFIVKHDLYDTPWIDAHLDRLAVVQVFLPALTDFVHNAKPPSRGEWGLSAMDLAHFTDILADPIALRADIHTAQWVRFRFSLPSDDSLFQMPTQWLHLSLWDDFPIHTWVLDDTDPFWLAWLKFLRQIATYQLPAELKLLNHNWIRNLQDGIAHETDEQWPQLAVLPFCHFFAEPVEHPGHFRLRLTETDLWRAEFLLLDEVLDQRAFVGGFCIALEELFAHYKPLPDESGEVFDLRTLPWDELRKLI